MSGSNSPDSSQPELDDGAPDQPRQPGTDLSSTGPDPGTKAKKPAGAVLIVLTCVFLFAAGMGSGYLNWGTANKESQPATATPSTSSPKRVVGTRENPLPIGTEVTIDDWTVVLDSPQNGTTIVADESEFTDVPQEGFDFYLVPITATYQGKEIGIAWMDLKFKFVGSDARTYSNECARYPNPLRDVDELYNGGTAEGNQCVEVPKGAAGLWVVSTGSKDADKVFFNAK